MKTIPDWPTPTRTLRSGKPEVRLEIDRARAADLGVSVLDIEQALNTLVAGQVASTFNAGDDQYDVRVRAQEQFRGSAEGLAQDDGALVQDSAPCRSTRWSHIAPGTGPSSINRINRQRQVTVTGNVLPGGSQADILGQLERVSRTSSDMEPDYRSGLTGGVEGTGAHRLLLHAGVLADLHLHVHRAGGAVRIVHPPDHDSDHAAAGGAVRDRVAAASPTRRSTSSPAWGCCCCSASSRRTRFCRSTTRTACARRA